MNRKEIIILGVPFNGVGIPPEKENPAQAIRDAGLISRLNFCGITVEDWGDVPIADFDGHRDQATQILNLQAWKETSLGLSAKLGEIIDGGTYALVLGGDCGILLGIIGAFSLRSRTIGLVSLDGHADFRSPTASPSGEAADLPLWVLTGRGPAEITDLYNASKMLHDDEIAVYGFREPDMIHDSSIVAYDRHRMGEIGIAKSIRDGLNPQLERRELDLWLHFDVDVIDPEQMPAVQFPEPDGLSIKETREFLQCVLSTDRVVGISLACYHPNLDGDGLAAERLVTLMADVLAGNDG
jgi:arginase